MGKTERQRMLKAAYQERRVVGGVCLVRCVPNGACALLTAVELRSQRNRFELAVSTGMPLLPSMGPDWRTYGAASFAFEVLEELERKSEQTDKAFQADLAALAALWREKLAAEGTVFYI